MPNIKYPDDIIFNDKYLEIFKLYLKNYIN
jgi:hypothetical protein